MNGTQVTESEPHTRSLKTGKYESGGPFYTELFEDDRTPNFSSGEAEVRNSKNVRTSAFKWHQAPTIFPSAAVERYEKASIPSRSKDTSDLDHFGATAIANCAPANPASELGTGVSELYREGLPSLPGVQTWKERTALAKGAGSEYLNKVFGWDPLVGEVRAFANIVQRHRDIMKQYERDAGKLVHRKFHFPDVTTETELYRAEESCSIAGAGGTAIDDGKGIISITSGNTVRRWFSGAFTYDVPSQVDSWKKALGYGSEADVVAGASLNPELLWNLTPWSWAVDWFSNTGDVLENVSSYLRAGQVMRYGYMMEESESFVQMSASRSGKKGAPAPRPWRKFRRSKVRRAANPFGFGLSFSDLSPEQLLIAAALGITLL